MRWSKFDSDFDWIHFSIWIITFVTESQIWWFKMIQKEDLWWLNLILTSFGHFYLDDWKFFYLKEVYWSYIYFVFFSLHSYIYHVINLQKIIMKRKRIKPNKYQLKSDLTGSIWLAEDYPRSSQLKSDFSESIQLT